MRRKILEDEGISIVLTEPDIGLIEVVPKKTDVFSLYDLHQRVNAMDEYKIIKMDVVVTGKLQEVEIEYGVNTPYPEKVKQYKLSAGEPFDFILSKGEKLNEMLDNKNDAFKVIGTITSFKGTVPILDIKAYKLLKEWPE